MSSNPWDHQHEEEHDEGWLVSYADMVTLLFGFFVILYSLSAVDEKKYNAMSEKIVEAFTGKEGKKVSEVDTGFMSEFRQLRAFKLLVERLNLGEDMEQAVRAIEKATDSEKEAAIAKKLLESKLTETEKKELEFMRSLGKNQANQAYLELILPESALFSPGSDAIRPESALKMQKIAAQIGQLPNVAMVEIVGHTDSTLPSAQARFRDNWSLSSARAGAVARVLLENGIPRTSLNIKGMADLQPMADESVNDPIQKSTNRSKNRRVHIIVKKVETKL